MASAHDRRLESESTGHVGVFKRFLSYYGPQKHLFWADMACALIVAAIDLAFPQILRSLTNGLFVGPSAQIYHALFILLVGLVAMYAIRYFCRYFVCSWGQDRRRWRRQSGCARSPRLQTT